MATSKDQKIARLVGGPEPQRPVPQVPRLPNFLRERFPDKAEEIDAYNEAWVTFMKQTGTIAGS